MEKKPIDIDSLSVDNQIKEFIKSQKDITIDKYSSKGGNSELFFGMHNILKSRVALKFYYVQSESAHEEVKLLNQINHPNILQVLDAKVISDEYAFFLTPEVSGGDLEEFITQAAIDINTALDITKGVLVGATALHGNPNRLVHRDLKPRNILIDDKKIPKIADFGSVKRMPTDKEIIKGSKHTFIYRPPESILNNDYCYQSDIYQVGILLFQLLGGFFPNIDASWLTPKQRKHYSNISGDFEKQKYFNDIIGKRIRNGMLLILNSLPSYICNSLKSIIRCATHPDLEKRYRTTSEFLKSINDFSSNSVNWWKEGNIYHAEKGGNIYYKIINEEKAIIVQKQTSSKSWRRDNKINGTLCEIFEKINHL